MHIDATINSVKVTFDFKKREVEKSDVGVKLSDIQTKVIELIKNNPSITHGEIAEILSITKRTAERTTKDLRELKIIRREGSDKKGIWKLL